MSWTLPSEERTSISLPKGQCINSNYSTNKEIVVACIIFNEKHHCKE